MKCSDQNSSHRQRQKFATETRKYEFVKEFWQLTLKREKWAHMLQIQYKNIAENIAELICHQTQNTE